MISDFDVEGKNKFQKACYYFRYYGISYTVKKALRKFGVPISEESEYMTWCRRNTASSKELDLQRKDALSGKFSFVIVSEEDPADAAQSGWRRQTCKNVSFVQITEETELGALLEKNPGEYFVFSGRDIKALPEFLYEISGAADRRHRQYSSRIRIENKKQPDLIYTDEDNCVGKKRYRPFFKPDASMQMLLNFPYLGRCFAVKRSLLEKISRSRVEIELYGNDWYDLSLQAFFRAEHIFHIPEVLFSNVVSEDRKDSFVRSGGEDPISCIRRFLKSVNIGAEVTETDVPGFFHARYELAQKPLISIVIPNKDHTEDLKKCLDSLKRCSYDNYEVIIAENNSEDEQTFAFYEKLTEEDARIRVVVWEGAFNYSAINNFAARKANGELFLFLNNDTEFIGSDTLYELAASVLKPGVGACGAMLYYGDQTIQHAGVIIGMGGFAAHALWSLTDRDEKYFPFSLCEREVSGVTGACLMVRRSVYEEVGGMGEDFVVALNDVDLCLKIRAAGYKILFNPFAKLYHYESKSRGYEDTMEKQTRFQSEIERLQKKWREEIEQGDPYYNRNLTLHRADYSMDV